MEAGLKRLELIKNNKYRCTGQNAVIVERLEQYAKGEIDSFGLVADLSPEDKAKVYLGLNSMLNYRDVEVKYYIPRPLDMHLNNPECPAIIAGEEKDGDFRHTHVSRLGPSPLHEWWPGLYSAYFYELEGDFSSIPNGVVLYPSDWIRIVSKNPDLAESILNLMKNDYQEGYRHANATIEDAQAKINKELDWAQRDPDAKNVWYQGKDHAQHLPDEVIDSITIVRPVEYIKLEELIHGDFGTYQELKERNVSDGGQGKPKGNIKR